MPITSLNSSGQGLVIPKDSPTYALLFDNLILSIEAEPAIYWPLSDSFPSYSYPKSTYHFCFDAAIKLTTTKFVLDIFNKVRNIGLLYDRLEKEDRPLQEVKGAFLIKDEHNTRFNLCIEDGQIQGDVYKVEDGIVYLRFYIHTDAYKLMPDLS